MGEQSKNVIHLVKLCVGVDSLAQLEGWREKKRRETGVAESRHVTRMWPKQEEKLLNGGSLYWVFKSVILARQRVVRLDEVVREDGIRRCGLVLDREVVRTHAAPRRPFQGWRYLKPEDAPRDLPKGRQGESELPRELETALAEIGIL